MEVSVEQAVEIDVPSARAWELVSTSAGISSWFVSADVVPGPSGSVTLRFGPGAEGTMPIQAWEPPLRIRFGAREGEPGRAHDFRVAASATGGATVRVVDSGLEEGDAGGALQAWAGYLNKLKAHAEKVEESVDGGQPATP